MGFSTRDTTAPARAGPGAALPLPAPPGPDQTYRKRELGAGGQKRALGIPPMRGAGTRLSPAGTQTHLQPLQRWGAQQGFGTVTPPGNGRELHRAGSRRRAPALPVPQHDPIPNPPMAGMKCQKGAAGREPSLENSPWRNHYEKKATCDNPPPRALQHPAGEQQKDRRVPGRGQSPCGSPDPRGTQRRGCKLQGAGHVNRDRGLGGPCWGIPAPHFVLCLPSGTKTRRHIGGGQKPSQPSFPPHQQHPLGWGLWSREQLHRTMWGKKKQIFPGKSLCNTALPPPPPPQPGASLGGSGAGSQARRCGGSVLEPGRRC